MNCACHGPKKKKLIFSTKTFSISQLLLFINSKSIKIARHILCMSASVEVFVHSAAGYITFLARFTVTMSNIINFVHIVPAVKLMPSNIAHMKNYHVMIMNDQFRHSASPLRLQRENMTEKINKSFLGSGHKKKKKTEMEMEWKILSLKRR